MTEAVVFALAVEPSVSTPPEAAPPAVLARQLPRLVVHLLNGDHDRGLRFFPFMGREGTVRSFIDLPELLPTKSLRTMHGQQPEPRLLVDGCVFDRALRLRILRGNGEEFFDEELPFDPAAPLPVVSRIMFEIMGALHWSGGPPRTPALDREALRRYLVARDDLLALEAEVIDAASRDPLRSALLALESAPQEREARTLFLDVAARSVGVIRTDEIVSSLRRACALVASRDPVAADFFGTAGTVFDACGEPVEALRHYESAVAADPTDAVSVCRAATMHFESGRMLEARNLLRAAVAAGQNDTTLIAQLAVVEQHVGDSEARAELLERLVAARDLRPPVVRIVIDHLLEQARAVEALRLADSCLAAEPGAVGVLFDRGRCLAALGRRDEAVSAFEACKRNAPGAILSREIERQLRFVSTPGVLEHMHRLDETFASGDLDSALLRARSFVRSRPDFAEAWLCLGLALQRLQRPRRAERALRRAIDLDGNLGEARNRLGILLVGRGKGSEAYDHLREAVRLLPHESGVFLHLAQACHLIGREDEARQAVARAEALGARPDLVAQVRGLIA